MTKFCKDCKWFRPPESPDRIEKFSRCLNPAGTGGQIVSLVTGNNESPEPVSYCDIERIEGKCGLEGKLWEAK